MKFSGMLVKEACAEYGKIGKKKFFEMTRDEIHAQLDKLQDLEFTLESGKLYTWFFCQTHNLSFEPDLPYLIAPENLNPFLLR